jgi:hypothetical protein
MRIRCLWLVVVVGVVMVSVAAPRGQQAAVKPVLIKTARLLDVRAGV